MTRPTPPAHRSSVACFPGSFSPPTIAHLAITHAACQVSGVDRVEWVVSRRALTKEHVSVPTLDHRLEVLSAVAASRPWLTVSVTDDQLIADIAAGYSAVVLGADKWHQIHDVSFYDNEAERDAAVASLPRPLLVPRAGHDLDVPGGHVLDIDSVHLHVSSSRARDGARDLMLDEARAFDDLTGAWTDPDRYRPQ